jgi:CHAD domain-containing protein
VVYVLEPARSVTHEVRRVAYERLDEALEILDALGADGAEIEESVHEVRKRCKESRAIARLVRSSLGNEYPRFNRLVREAAETLAPIRDAHAVLATFDDLRSIGVHDPELDDIRSAQAAAASAASDSVSAGDPRIRRARRLLKTARKSVKRWHVGKGFATLRVGIEDTYRAGRRALRRAVKKPTDDRLHEWRKSVKHLLYQVRLVELAAPSVLQALESRLDALSEALGDDHDLAVMIERIQVASSRSNAPFDSPARSRTISGDGRSGSEPRSTPRRPPHSVAASRPTGTAPSTMAPNSRPAASQGWRTTIRSKPADDGGVRRAIVRYQICSTLGGFGCRAGT